MLKTVQMSYFIIIRGPLGCGKSTLAKKLAATLKAKLIQIDKILDDNNLTGDKEDGYISQRSFEKANSIIAPTAKELLERQTPIIFDGNFYWKSQIDDLLRQLPYPHLIFTLKAPLQVCIDRDAKRKTPHGKDATSAVYAKSTQFECGINIDATKNISTQLNEIISHLRI